MVERTRGDDIPSIQSVFRFSGDLYCYRSFSILLKRCFVCRRSFLSFLAIQKILTGCCPNYQVCVTMTSCISPVLIVCRKNFVWQEPGTSCGWEEERKNWRILPGIIPACTTLWASLTNGFISYKTRNPTLKFHSFTVYYICCAYYYC